MGIRLFKAKTWDQCGLALPPFAEVKEDGHRIMVQRAKNGQMFAMTTSFIDIIGQLRHRDWWPLCEEYLRPGEQLDGELVVPGGTSEHVKTALSVSGDLEFKPFATTQLPDRTPTDVVDAHLKNVGGFTTPGYVLCPPHDAQTLFGYAEARGWEGWVLKRGNYHDWYKLKCEKTIDLIIKAYNDGKGKYAGAIGSFACVTAEGHHVANVSGMNDAVRWETRGLIGLVIEVSYQRVGRQGRLLLPRFKRFRDDKLPSQCSVGQDKKLKEYWKCRSS